MKLAYVTIFDATDIRNWSGLDLHIWKSLQAAGCEITLVGNLGHGKSITRKARKLWGTLVERKSFMHLWDVDTARGYAAAASKRIRNCDVDAIICPSPIPLAFLQCDVPKFLWTDATFLGLLDFYTEFSRKNLSSPSVRSGLAIDRAVLANCDTAIYSSHWAAEGARAGYPMQSSRLAVVPYGANVDPWSEEEIEQVLMTRSGDTLRLLFVGMDWERKGGEMAVRVAAAVEQRGIPVELTIVGTGPDPSEFVPSFVSNLGVIDKSSVEGQRKFLNILSKTHFLILPSRAECCAVALAEAHAFGLPCVATDVGGIPTVVQDGVTGKLFRLEDAADTWAAWLIKNFKDRSAYEKLSRSAYKFYSAELNWEIAGQRVRKLIAERLSR